MAIEFGAEDVYEMARQIEGEASAFYKRAASASGSPTCRRLLLELASMEVEHEQLFATMKAGTSARPPAPAIGAGEKAGRNRPDLTRMLMSGIAEDLAARFTGRETDEEILRKAIVFEKDTIVFFLDMKSYVFTDADSKRIDELISEELGHVLQLTGQLARPGLRAAGPARDAGAAGEEEPRGRDVPLE